MQLQKVVVLSCGNISRSVTGRATNYLILGYICSQIKLPPYDFSDLKITGRFLTYVPCIVTNCTGAGRRLYYDNIEFIDRCVLTSLFVNNCFICEKSAGHRTVCQDHHSSSCLLRNRLSKKKTKPYSERDE